MTELQDQDIHSFDEYKKAYFPTAAIRAAEREEAPYDLGKRLATEAVLSVGVDAPA